MSQSETGNKLCLACGKILRGRPDKKYCNVGCRNRYNNSRQEDGSNTIRKINRVLLKNRRILQKLLQAEEKPFRITGEKLQDTGFRFEYITHFYINHKKGNVYYFCYDFGYLPLKNDWYLILKDKEE